MTDSVEKGTVGMFQIAIDKLLNDKKDIDNKISRLTRQAEQAGYTILNGQVIDNKPVWAIIWDIRFYSRYVGEKGPMYHLREGARVITQAQYDVLREAFISEDDEPIIEIMSDYADVWFLDGRMDRGDYEWMEDDLELHWSSNGDDQGDLVNSSITIKKMTQSQINRIKDDDRDDVFL